MGVVDQSIQIKRRGIRCPHCGSTNAAKILWGMYDPEMYEDPDVKSGKLYIAGCSPEFVSIEYADGSFYMGPAKRHCNDCDKNY